MRDKEGGMSAFGTGLAGLVGGVVLLMSLFSFCQRKWTAGCAWLLSGVVLIALLTFIDKPGSSWSVSSEAREARD
jgi:protein-S-isoprenylcysteine O-methyltransferase Ste14